MKNVLLYANEDAGLESRLQAAFDVARAFAAHLDCVQIRPFESQIIGDPFGGTYAMQMLLAEVTTGERAHQARMEARLNAEHVSWEWAHQDGDPARILVDRSCLADLIVLSLNDDQRALLSGVAVHARAPVLAVPPGSKGLNCFGNAMIAWNGSPEAANAVRLTLPMLAKAGAVKVVTVTERTSGFPVIDASQYLARHGITSELHELPGGDSPAAHVLIDAAARLGADYVVMGAYGHSRFREAILGGATKTLIHDGRVPLLLAH